MPVEIERKYLLASEAWRQSIRSSHPMRQGYLGGDRCSVRVRISGDQAWLNIKSRVKGARRLEFEYPIPLDDGHELLNELADGPLVEKVRHEVMVGEHCWEIDEFSGDNQGLVVAEIELQDEDEAFERPAWLGREVTDEERYYNIALSVRPYNTWGRS